MGSNALLLYRKEQRAYFMITKFAWRCLATLRVSCYVSHRYITAQFPLLHFVLAKMLCRYSTHATYMLLFLGWVRGLLNYSLLARSNSGAEHFSVFTCCSFACMHAPQQPDLAARPEPRQRKPEKLSFGTLIGRSYLVFTNLSNCNGCNDSVTCIFYLL